MARADAPSIQDGVEDPPTFKDLLTRVSDLLYNDALKEEITSRFDRVITGLDFLKRVSNIDQYVVLWRSLCVIPLCVGGR